MNEKTTSPLQDAFKKCRFVLLAVAVISLFVNVLMLTVPLFMLQIYGRVLVSRSTETLIYLSIMAVGALLVMAALDFTRSRSLSHLSAWLENRLGPEVLPPAISQQLQSQTYGVQALRDVSQVRQFMASPGIFSLFDAPWVPVYLFVIYLQRADDGNGKQDRVQQVDHKQVDRHPRRIEQRENPRAGHKLAHLGDVPQRLDTIGLGLQLLADRRRQHFRAQAILQPGAQLR